MFTNPITFNSQQEAAPGGNTAFPGRDAYAVFDGVDDYVSIPSNSVTNALTNMMSFAFWINPKSFLADSRLIERGAIGSVNQFTIMLNSTTGRLRATIDGQTLLVDVANSLIVGEWSFVVYTYDGTTARFYINGSEVKSAVQSIDITGGTGNIYISKSHLAGNYVNAYMRDVRIYNDALTSGEVTYLYTEGASGTDPTNTNLIGHWKFDEGEWSDIADSSGNGNNGVAYNITEPVFWDKYATFDGVNDYVNAASTALPSGSSSRSVSFWFNPGTTGSTQDAVVYGVNSLGARFAITANQDRQSIAVNGHEWGVSASLSGWNHFVLTFPSGSTSSNQFLIYLNGVLQSSATLTGVPTTVNTSSSGSLNIGRRIDGASYYNGSIRDVAVYSDELTASEITYLYNVGLSGTNPTSANLVGRWKLTEGEGSFVEDFGSGGNDGTAINITEPLFWHQPHAYFDGVNDYVLANNPLTTSGTAFSAGFWVNSDEYRYALPFVIWDGSTSMTSRTISIEWRVAGQGLWIRAFDATGTGIFFLSLTQLSNATWHHICLTYAGGTGLVKVYVNGVLAGSGSPSANIYMRSSLGFGGMKTTTNTIFFGKMRTVNLYDDELTANEALYLATAGQQGTDPTTANLVGQWKLDDRYGTTAFDSAGTNDGTATNITESTFWIQ